MKFTKMHGLGNDYIYIDCFHETVTDPAGLSIKMSHRHFGIGGDGIVMILPSTVADARMRMFNAVGSEAEMCGNAIRCVGKYLYEHSLVCKEKITIETMAGIKYLNLQINCAKVECVTVDMGEPILEGINVPVLIEKTPVLKQPISIGARHYEFTAVSMGNPHCVIFVPEITDEMVLNDGPQLEIHSLFPKKTNVEFVTVIDRQNLAMRVWERGSGETMACGTGACATLVAAVLNQYCNSKATIHLLGGELRIEWNPDNRHVLMTGPATEVFEGDWKL
jgi:diaminopimelate epimerase